MHRLERVPDFQHTAKGHAMQSPVFLVLINVPEQDWSHKIDDERRVLGRSADARIQIPLHYARVSRRHATVWREKSETWLQDEGSKYGTLVNGIFLKSGQPVKITVGDRITLADVELTVVGQLSKLAELMAETGIRARFAGRDGNGTETESVHFQPLDMARATLEQLTPAELDIVLWMYRGYTNDAELGQVLFRSPHTIRTQVASIFGKLDIHSRADIVTWLKRCGNLRPDEQKRLSPDTRTIRIVPPRKRTRSGSG